MIEIPLSEFKDYDMTGVLHAVVNGDVATLYYSGDQYAIGATLEQKKLEKMQIARTNKYKNQHARNIDIDVLGFGIGRYNNSKAGFSKINASVVLALSRKIRRDGVRILHNPAQITQVKMKMIERWESLDDWLDDTEDDIEAASTIEELDAIDVSGNI